AYVNRAVTRAGAEGVLTTNGTGDGQVSLEQKGFGVFAYYTDDDLYSPIYQPNFMYNTKVSKSTTDWTYNPVRYWPNEFGSNAASEGVDRLSFFAYAPWVEVTPSTGIVTGDETSGIVGLSRNAATGDPLVKYYASLDPQHQVDFSWGVNKTSKKPNVNMTKQGVTEKVEFEFNHALAALNVQVDAIVDDLSNNGIQLGTGTDGTTESPVNTWIYVRSVTFEGFVTKGAFNLNTDKAVWYDLAGANYIDGGSVSVYDGRTNGREAQSESVNEAPTGLNPVIVQSQPFSGTPTAGVTNTPVNLFNGAAATDPVYVIPSSQPLRVTIVYDVETRTDELAGYLSDGETHGTSVENKITKAITFDGGNKLEAGKQYTLNLHLGMTSVKFDATVADWDTSTITGESDLPHNIAAVTGISINPLSSNVVGADLSKQLEVTFSPAGATNQNVTWTSSDPTKVTVDENGVVTGVSGGTDGPVTITVTSEDGGFTATIELSYVATPVNVTGVTVAPTTKEIGAGGTFNLTATVAPADATEKGVTWSSSDPAVATVDANGVVTAKAAGTATITATTVDGAKTATCEVTVTAPIPLEAVSLNKNSIPELVKGSNDQLVATLNPTDATMQSVVWTSSDSNVATVDQNGLVTAKGGGTAIITVTATDVEGNVKTATCTVTVPYSKLDELSALVNSDPDADLSEYVGNKFIDKDGNLIDVPASGIPSDAVGFLLLYDQNGVDDTIKPGTSDEKYKFLVIAVQYISGSYWSYSSPGGGISQSLGLENNAQADKNLANGLDLTTRMVAANKAYTESAAYDSSKPYLYTAAQKVHDLTTEKPANSSDWFLPSYHQWENILASEGYTVLKAKSQGIFQNYYWTITEEWDTTWNRSTNAYCVLFNNNTVNLSRYDKMHNCRLLPVFAF
ncbi:MAG: Ig-like domain-containing protein, partial [Bacteroidaceae bacterium]|nr:Ig-like domain-containing protein [Bacteroidaceae bacterium]